MFSLFFDRNFFARHGTDAVFSVSILHITEAIFILIWPVEASGATCMIGVRWLVNFFGNPDGLKIVASVMILSALLALTGIMFRVGPVRISLFIIQQAMLGAQTGAWIVAAWGGAYLDGTKVPWQHIVTDQLIFLAMFAVHWRAIFKRSRDPNG